LTMNRKITGKDLMITKMNLRMLRRRNWLLTRSYFMKTTKPMRSRQQKFAEYLG
jgi:hypothetical protein